MTQNHLSENLFRSVELNCTQNNHNTSEKESGQLQFWT